MARPRTGPGEDEAVDDETNAEETDASQMKSAPEGALPPTERTTRSGETSYTREYLIANAFALTGHEPHVLVGALHGNDQDYLTPADAAKAAETWLASEDTTEG